MTTDTPPRRYVTEREWSRLLALLDLPNSADVSAVIAAVEGRKRSAKDRAQAERDARATAIRECRCCDQRGWQLDADGLPVDPAGKCEHDAPPTSGSPPRSFSEPLRGELADDTEECP